MDDSLKARLGDAIAKYQDPKTELYKLDEAAKYANCQPDRLLKAGIFREEFEIMVAVPDGYGICLLKENCSPINHGTVERYGSGIIGTPLLKMIPNLLVLRQYQCSQLILTGEAEISMVSKGYKWRHEFSFLREMHPINCDETLPVINTDTKNLDFRTHWNAWRIYKLESGAPLRIEKEHVLIAKTQLDKLLDLKRKKSKNVKTHSSNADSKPLTQVLADLLAAHNGGIDSKLKANFDKLRFIGKVHGSIRLRIMNIVSRKRWSKKAGVYKEYSSTQPRNNAIAEELINYRVGVFSRRLAKAAAQIIRPEFAIKGPIKEDRPGPGELPDVEKGYLSDKLKIMNETSQLFYYSTEVDKNDKATFPNDEEIINHLKEKGFGDTLARKAVLILKPDLASSANQKEPAIKNPDMRHKPDLLDLIVKANKPKKNTPSTD